MLIIINNIQSFVGSYTQLSPLSADNRCKKILIVEVKIIYLLNVDKRPPQDTLKSLIIKEKFTRNILILKHSNKYSLFSKVS